MITVFLIAAFAHWAASQTYECQCAFFVPEQAPGQIGAASPIPLNWTIIEVDPNSCSEPTAGNNTCQFVCDNWAADTGATLDFCDGKVEGNISRCYGGLYCEGLYQDNRIPDGGLVTSMRAWYRMPECPESSGYNNWNLATYEFPMALCCSDIGRYDTCYAEDCTCVKSVSILNYCETGVFAMVQFQQGNDENDPIPFKMFSGSVGDDAFSFCDQFEANPPNEVCEEYFTPIGQAYFANYTLLDKANLVYSNVQDPEITLGQLYCSTLRSRRIFYDQYIDTELRFFKRAPLCDILPNNIQWENFSPQLDHPERLCCTSEGNHEYPCPTQ